MKQITTDDVTGRTANGQDVVASGSDTFDREMVDDGFSENWVESGAETTWYAEGDTPDSMPLTVNRCDPDSAMAQNQRLWALNNDRQHPKSASLGYSTADSQDNRKSRERFDSAEFVHSQFWTPSYVTDKNVAEQMDQYDGEIESVLSGYGGLDFVAVVAITEVWTDDDEEIWTNEAFMDEFSALMDYIDAPVKFSKAKRKLFELRNRSGGDDE